ncbi:MAG: bifunctional phosphopantothenoylcysteine decarboxylase/phosphopantothenate--cysteine ligase CoaBC [Candidatus Bipolaricaulia bacterium]
MSVLSGKVIVAGICGGIAAYKAAGVVSQLQQAGAEVRVIMTRAACEFVTPLTFESLSRHRVSTDLFRDEPLAHVKLAHQADLVVVMPATYNLIGKVAYGIADDHLTTTIAATRAPVLFVPAMESQMYENLLLQENKRRLEAFGYHFLEPEVGHLASGRSGIGRFPAQKKIIQSIEEILTERLLLERWKVVVTAGPTRERIDPMRCVTNRSSGKMGYALAEAARDLGAASVCLISGPTQLPPPAGVEQIRIESAEEMRDVVLEKAKACDVVIMAAAVADWQPKNPSKEKPSKLTQDEMTLVLDRTPDILKTLGEKLKRRKKRPLLVGFAGETGDLVEKARAKLEEKGLDLVIANDITRDDAGPESDTNIATLIYKDGRSEPLPKMSKYELAREILRRIAELDNTTIS